MNDKVPNYTITSLDLNLNPNSVTRVDERDSLASISPSLAYNALKVMEEVRNASSIISSSNLSEDLSLAKQRIHLKTKKRVLKENSTSGYIGVTFIILSGIITVSIAIFLFIGNVVLG